MGMPNHDDDIVDVVVNLRDGHNFTVSGANHIRDSVISYANELAQRSIKVGDASRANDAPLEITHEIVTRAAHQIFGTGIPQRKPKWYIAGNIVEYVCAGFIGWGASNYHTTSGQIAFFICIIIGAISIFARREYVKGDR